MENNLTEQTEIARKLGISNKAMRRIAEAAELKWTLINNKRHYKFEDFLEAIRKGGNGAHKILKTRLFP